MQAAQCHARMCANAKQPQRNQSQTWIPGFQEAQGEPGMLNSERFSYTENFVTFIWIILPCRWGRQ